MLSFTVSRTRCICFCLNIALTWSRKHGLVLRGLPLYGSASDHPPFGNDPEQEQGKLVSVEHRSHFALRITFFGGVAPSALQRSVNAIKRCKIQYLARPQTKCAVTTMSIGKSEFLLLGFETEAILPAWSGALKFCSE